jgi:DNA mismatch repair endonuclease MutH
MPKGEGGERLRRLYPDVETLMKKAELLIGKTLTEITDEIHKSDAVSRVVTKGTVGYMVEHFYFGVKINSDAEPDIKHLGIEIKTCPLKFDSTKTKLSVKEPLSLNMVNYCEEWKNDDIKQSSLYKKNKKTLFVCYIHDDGKNRSDYLIKYVFLWEMDDKVLEELRPDYELIIKKIREGKATDLHQKYNKWLTTCPKHGGVFRDPNCRLSKTKQPFSEKPAERRAFRLKNTYMNMIIARHLGKKLGKGGWEA